MPPGPFIPLMGASPVGGAGLPAKGAARSLVLETSQNPLKETPWKPPKTPLKETPWKPPKTPQAKDWLASHWQGFMSPAQLSRIRNTGGGWRVGWRRRVLGGGEAEGFWGGVGGGGFWVGWRRRGLGGRGVLEDLGLKVQDYGFWGLGGETGGLIGCFG